MVGIAFEEKAIPTRMRSPATVLDRNDAENVLALLVDFAAT
jgi:hypothetical protein